MFCYEAVMQLIVGILGGMNDELQELTDKLKYSRQATTGLDMEKLDRGKKLNMQKDCCYR